VTGFATLFFGLCTVFLLVSTAVDAWREHAQKGWPQATATIAQCRIDLRHYNGPDDDDPTWWLECPVRFRVGPDEIKTTIHSGHRSNPARDYPDLMNAWVSDHPDGSPIVVRYDPSDFRTAMPARDYMPNGSPRTGYDFRFLLVCSVAFISLLTITRLLLRRARRGS
jgi:hypothetical protein